MMRTANIYEIFLIFFGDIVATITNIIVEQPLISCSADAIYAKWKTKTTFNGNVTVQFVPNPNCYQTLITNNQIELLIPHHDCRLNRMRFISRAALMFESSVLITSNEKEIHKIRIRLIAVPHCKYKVQGHESKNIANTDQLLKHVWTCGIKAIDNLCFIVRNCFMIVNDSRQQLIDEHGCLMINDTIQAELDYNEKLKVTWKTKVNKIRLQKSSIYFRCQIVLVIDEKDCSRPNCSAKPRSVTRPFLFP
ncbi:unnamed protein product [Dracunculus medinensis]|uniref:ZP domain-containing protein n=1 Tax=Dracunculus medinensis TaxID=318479 RepID=A0A0N4UJB8_DRAME|nr:unnamed protein product [Dracunculus medinensis]